MQHNVESKAGIINLFDERIYGNKYKAKADAAKELEAHVKQAENDKLYTESIHKAAATAKTLFE